MLSNAHGLVVTGTAGGGVRFVVYGATYADLTGADRWRLVSALTAWASAGAADEHLERVARLSTASVG